MCTINSIFSEFFLKIATTVYVVYGWGEAKITYDFIFFFLQLCDENIYYIAIFGYFVKNLVKDEEEYWREIFPACEKNWVKNKKNIEGKYYPHVKKLGKK